MSLDIITLNRFGYTPFGTFGELTVHGWRCFTLERYWKNNTRNISCIPTGSYIMQLGLFMRSTPEPEDDYPAYELQDVPGRSAIKIHKGNTIDDSRGCILVGAWLGSLGKKWAVTESRKAYEGFMRQMAGVPEAVIDIRNCKEYLGV